MKSEHPKPPKGPKPQKNAEKLLTVPKGWKPHSVENYPSPWAKNKWDILSGTSSDEPHIIVSAMMASYQEGSIKRLRIVLLDQKRKKP